MPNNTFKKDIIFHEEGIEIFYSPGHTIDSISIFDYNERVLYVGDNLEKPIIYVESEDIFTYMSTLERYLRYKPKKIVAGHTLNIKEGDVTSTIDYLKKISEGKDFNFESEYEKNSLSKFSNSKNGIIQ